MNQRTFASHAEFEKYGRKSLREVFLDEMERIVPWSAMLPLVIGKSPFPSVGTAKPKIHSRT
jgi:IS5 family transposase